MIAHPNGNFLFTIEDDKSVRVWDIENKSEAFQFLSNKDPPTSIGVPNKAIFACGFTSGMLKIFDLDKTSILYESKPWSTPVKALKFIQEDSLLISINSQGHMSIHDSLNKFIQIKVIRIDEPSPNVDISLTLEEDYFATIGPDANCVIIWNSKTFGVKNRIPINNFFINKLCLINKNLVSVILENCCVQFYSLASYEGILVKEFYNIHINKINDFLVTKNCKYLISGGEEGMIKVWDSKMLYKPHTSYQQFIGHSSGIRSVLCIESKSLLITASENSGIYFWNFLGDLTFCETEISQELEKFGNAKDMKEFVNFNSNNTNKKAAINTSNMSMSNIKASHLEKTYKLEHNINANTQTKSKLHHHMDMGDHGASQVLNMLPIEFEEDDGMDLSYSASNLMNSDAFNKSAQNYNILTNADDLNNKILYTPNYLPTKIDKL